MSRIINDSISKQAIFERVDSDFINLCRELLSRSFGSKLKATSLLKKFRNVYIQDSSCVYLPDSLYEFYQGNTNRTGKHSIAKIQVIYNLLKNDFEELKLSSFTRNDQAASLDILDYIHPEDLIIRDLGYFTIKSLKEIINRKAHFICPLRKDVHLFSEDNQEKIDIKKLLKNRRFINKKVLLGAEHLLPVTLVAIKLDEKTASYRRRCAMNNRDWRMKITEEKLFLLGWDIFITSCETLQPQDIKDIYGLRWQIEIIFKSWKSHLKLEKNIPLNATRPFIPEAIIYLTLLLTVLFIMPVYRFATKMANEISLLKLTRFISLIMPQNNWTLNYNKLFKNIKLITYEVRARASVRNKIAFLT